MKRSMVCCGLVFMTCAMTIHSAEDPNKYFERYKTLYSVRLEKADKDLKKAEAAFVKALKKAEAVFVKAQKGRDSAAIDATKKYLKILNTLKVYWTNKGKLEKALEFKNLIEEHQALVDDGKVPAVSPLERSSTERIATSVRNKWKVNSSGLKVVTQHKDNLPINFYRSVGVGLTELKPEGWKESKKQAGIKRLYGRFSFGPDMTVNVMVDVLNDKDSKIYVTYDEDRNFSTAKATRMPAEIELSVRYGKRKEPYTLRFSLPMYPGRPVSQYRLSYARRSLRVGNLRLYGKNYEFIVSDEDVDGDFSDLDTTRFCIDEFSSLKMINPSNSFELGGKYFIIATISESGDAITIKRSPLSTVKGKVIDSITGKPIRSATIKLPLSIMAKTDLRGLYSAKVPKGTYPAPVVVANGYVPSASAKVRTLNVSGDKTLDYDIDLVRPAADVQSGTVQLRNGDSYDFLSGKKSRFGTGGFRVIIPTNIGQPYFYPSRPNHKGIQPVGKTSAKLTRVRVNKNDFRRGSSIAQVGHVYISEAGVEEEGCHVVFRVMKIVPGDSISLDYYYKVGKTFNPFATDK